MEALETDFSELAVFTGKKPPDWDDPNYRWFIWQYSCSLIDMSMGNNVWFGRLTDDHYSVDFLGYTFNKDQIMDSFQAGDSNVETCDPIHEPPPSTIEYKDLGGGQAEARCRANIVCEINGNQYDKTVEMVHQIHSYVGSDGKTRWIADSSTIS